MIPNEEHVTTKDGVRLFVQTVGNGQDAVVIPNRIYLWDAFARLADRRRVIFFDPRNRGRSDQITDTSKLARGVHHDVDDLEAIRRHYGLDRLNLIGHSYMGVVVVLYAMKYSDHAGRIVQIGSVGPDYSRQFPPDLTNTDGTLRETLAKLGELQKVRQSYGAEEFCKKFWAVLRALYVAEAADVDRLKWEPCDLPNEMNFMKQWTDHVLPSIQNLHLSDDDIVKVNASVLAIHGRKDRSSPYGGGREWAMKLPNARLVTVERAAHVPWIEEPEMVFGAIETFLQGGWPRISEKVDVLDRLAPSREPA